MRVWDIVAAVEAIAPLEWAESWDNAGLQAGDPDREVQRVLVAVDATSEVLSEAADSGAEMVLVHHPRIFKPLPNVTPGSAPVVFEALTRGIAIYAAHTNFDAAPGGTNDVLADVLGLDDRKALDPMVSEQSVKIVVFVPEGDLQTVADAAFEAGAGCIGQYDRCSFRSGGTGTFRGSEGTTPTVGTPGVWEQAPEVRLEIICPRARMAGAVRAIREAHSYEEPAIDVYPVIVAPAGAGHGRVGDLPEPTAAKDLLERIRSRLRVDHLRIVGQLPATVSRVGCAAGSGKCLLPAADRAGAEVLLTGEIGYHDAVDCPPSLAVVCAGHGVSERIAMERLANRLNNELDGVKVLASKLACQPFRLG
jgi:dinuclear metal center YbgI/SA1388 family protein